MFGGSLGRLGGGLGTCQAFFYGTININISGGMINANVYGAGAGGVTGYDFINTNSSDVNKALGQDYQTAVNINVTGGTVNGSIYGAGYRSFSIFISKRDYSRWWYIIWKF